MTDNTRIPTGGTGDVISTDELTTLNGADVSGLSPRQKVQRIKAGFGVDGTLQDVTAAQPMPTADSVVAALITALTALIPPALGTGGGMKVSEVTALAGEDFNGGFFAMSKKPHGLAGYSSLIYQSLAAVTKANFKVGVGNIFGGRILNYNTAVRYVQIHDKASTPAGGDTPLVAFDLAAGTATVPFALNITDLIKECGPIHFTLGLAWAVSTTRSTFTDAATAADHPATFFYV